VASVTSPPMPSPRITATSGDLLITCLPWLTSGQPDLCLEPNHVIGTLVDQCFELGPHGGVRSMDFIVSSRRK